MMARPTWIAAAMASALLAAHPAAARPVSEAAVTSAEARVRAAVDEGAMATAAEEALSLLNLLTDARNELPATINRDAALELVRDTLTKAGRTDDADRAEAAMTNGASEPSDQDSAAAMAASEPETPPTIAQLAENAKNAPRTGNGAAAIEAYAILADALESSSQLAEAADAYRELLALQVQFQPKELDERIGTVRKLIWVLDQLGRNSEAISLARATLPLAEQAWRDTGATETDNGSFNSLTAAMSISNLQSMLAGSLSRQGEDAESDAYFAKALAWRNRYFSRQIAPHANLYNQMAFYMNFRGRFAEAEVAANTALSIMQSLGSDDWEPDITIAKYKYNLASSLLGRGEASAAIPLLRYGVPVQRGQFGPNHPDLAILLSTLSRAIVSSGDDYVEALTLAREAATIARGHRDARMAGGTAQAGDAQAAALARAVAGDTATNDPLAMAYGALLEATVAAAPRMARDKDSLFAESFVAAQDIEQSVAGQAMAAAAARRFAGEGPLGMLITAKQKMTVRAQTGNAALAAALAEGDQSRVAAVRADLGRITAELAALDATLARDHPAAEKLIAPKSVVPQAIQARLGAEEAMLFIVPSGTNVYAFAVTRDGTAVHVARDVAAAVSADVRRLRCRVDEVGCTNEADVDPTDPVDRVGIDAFFPRYDAKAAHALFTTLIAPLDSLLANKKTVFVTASGSLSSLPFAMLLTAPPVADTHDSAALQQRAWLGDRHAFVTLPSVAALTVIRDTAVAGAKAIDQQFVGYGAPLLSGSEATTRSVEAGGRRTALRGADPAPKAGGVEALRALASLPGTAIELERMAGTLGAKASAIRTGSAATEIAVRRDSDLTHAAVITFATHGLLAREIGSNAEPGLVFTPPTASSADDDGLLSASEAAELRLAAEWLILSACNTASADGAANGQSLSGLAKSFLHAGAKALLVSHWRVSDDVTAVLTVETIRLNRIDGLARPQALQAAMLAVRTGKRRDGSALPGWKPHWAHPAAWAPFVVVAADAR